MSKTFKIPLLREAFGKRGSFSRMDLYNFYKKIEPDFNETTLGWRLHHLKQQGIISVIKKGVYSLTHKLTYSPPAVEDIQKIHDKIIEKYPLVNFCVWNTRWLNDFMLHQAGRFLLIVETEADTTESIFFYLRDNDYKDVYLQPDEKVMSKYAYQNTETIIVKSLISKSPLQKINNIAVPKLEKILVDVFCEEAILASFRGNEMKNIFNAAHEKFDINFSILLTYAGRRGKKNEVIEYMKQHTKIPEKLFI